MSQLGTAKDGDMDALSSKVNVAVRVRPFNRRELELNSVCVVDMQDNQTILNTPSQTGKISTRKQKKTFAFDYCFWSIDPSQETKFADQETVFEKLGTDLLKNVFCGYNACIFAYGQTGSGKSYTMMGTHAKPGLIPRLCLALFNTIEEKKSDSQSFKVEVSYMEIYNEKVRDLLDPDGGTNHLRVREHKSLGPYVDGLQQLAVSAASDVQELMSEGNKSRTVAATKMNAESSRSHAVFTLVVTQTLVDIESNVSGERVSKVSLVDLAGSERASKTGASGDRLKEGSNINKSLTTLGLVISSLADQVPGKTKNKFVPYRDSVLTWILKDNLGGNSRTAMIATVSPSADNFEETLSTLRYADRAKRIVNKAVINEDPNARIIRELREEVEKLQLQLKKSESLRAPELKEKLEQSESLIKEISQTWEEKLRKTEEIHKQRQETLERMGLSLEKSGIKVEKTKCFLVNLNADPSLNELLVYYLKPKTVVGQSEASDMQLSGLGILDVHCTLEIIDDGLVDLTPEENARTCVNGRTVNLHTCLKHGDRILWGNNHFFRINIPRKSRIPTLITDPSWKQNEQTEFMKMNPSDSETSLNESAIDYEFAQQEVLMNQVEVPLQETIMHLEQEFQELENESTYSRLDMNERNRYEEEIKALRQQLMSLSPRGSSESLDRSTDAGTQRPKKELKLPDIETVTEPSLQYSAWKKERNNMLHASVTRLRQDLVRAQSTAQEANYLSKEMKKSTEFIVSLQIPAHNLTPNRRKGTLLCEPAIQVIRSSRDCQVWSVEKLENRLVEMRDMYLDYRDGGKEMRPNSTEYDPFDETERNQVLLGVANVFLSCLLQNYPFKYPVPIINQHGKVAGKLIVEVHRISGSVSDEILDSNNAESIASDTSEENEIDILSDTSSSGSSGIGSSLCIEALPATSSGRYQPDSYVDTSSNSLGYPASHGPVGVSNRTSHRKMKCRITVIEAQGLSPTLSHFVQCQYFFLDCSEVILVPPDLSPEELSPKSNRSTLNIKFHHSMDFTFNVTEELIDQINSGSSLAIEVWGHRDRYNHLETDEEISQSFTESRIRSSSLLSEKHKSLTERWSEVMKRIQVDLSILEVAEDGEYSPVEIMNKPNIQSRGIFQLKQGQSRRIHVAVQVLKKSGTLPLVIENVASVAAGSVQASEERLDSYSDIDLTKLRKIWLEVLERRKEYLDQEIKLLANKDKSMLEKEREASLLDQWLTLTEERNALVSPHSGIPGAPAAWSPPESVEMHIPVVFLNISAIESEKEFGLEVCSMDNLLPKELPETYIQLPIIRRGYDEAGNHVTALASWDSSLHDCLLLNRVTSSNEQVYAIIKICLHLSHPVEMDVILRKRICVSIYKQRGFTALLRRRLHGKEILSKSSLVCELVSGIPLSSQDDEDQETLAILAASGVKMEEERDNQPNQAKGIPTKNNPFDLYVTRSMQSVDDILSLDRIRQQVALRELLDQNSSKQRKQLL